MDGRSYRLLGFDPETYFGGCEQERQRGDAATARLKEVIGDPTRPNGTGMGAECARLFVNGEDIAPALAPHRVPYTATNSKTSWAAVTATRAEAGGEDRHGLPC